MEATPLKEINIQLGNDLAILDKGIVLSIIGNEVVFSPSYPVPVIMNIRQNENNDVFYILKNGETTHAFEKEWFVAGGSQSFVSENLEDVDGKKSNVIKSTLYGENVLKSVFFLPTEMDYRIVPVSDHISIGVVGGDVSEEILTITDPILKNNKFLSNVIDYIKSGKMCISNDYENEVLVWWNKNYLEGLINQ